MVRGAVRKHALRMDFHPFCQPSCPVNKLINEGGLLEDFPFKPTKTHRPILGTSGPSTRTRVSPVERIADADSIGHSCQKNTITQLKTKTGTLNLLKLLKKNLVTASGLIILYLLMQWLWDDEEF
ncbi:hypothetical protein PGTUg99_006517 [Puccinia graminis f. sp. tritici]|uniref:Uncharacterized protein n=1 Tax=Puccinia graminis f. sp. tritici TaxID=56615 RepID=A0A5B0PT79_PUCGR|nr:hypothetical protein PGTUg99_006517 [Puccinia graminis f. sp. tritici]